MTNKKITVAIIGASGYTGADAIRLLAAHPQTQIGVLAANAHAGEVLGAVHPQFSGLDLPPLQKPADIDWAGIDIALCGLPHGTAQDIIKDIPKSVKVIDMSADFRLKDTEVYTQYYGRPHQAQALLAETVYGLSEHYREEIKQARLVACPGCYPTAALTLLLPLVKAGCISPDELIIDAKSGVSGAGRGLQEGNLFCEIAESMRPYGIGTHRHTPEMEQELSKAANKPVKVNFTPHLVPINRGELLTVYAKLADNMNAEKLRAIWQDFYADAPFIRIAAAGEVPTTRHVRGSNFCLLGAFDDRLSGRAILIATLDNLVKGSSGQAIQNMNLMCGFEETSGLLQQPLYP